MASIVMRLVVILMLLAFDLVAFAEADNPSILIEDHAVAEDCQKRLYAALTKASVYVPHGRPISVTLEYCDDLCKALREVQTIQEERTLREEISTVLRECEP